MDGQGNNFSGRQMLQMGRKTTISSFAGIALTVCLLVLTSCRPSQTQAPAPESLEPHVRSLYAAWSSRDGTEVARLDPSAPGFGFRVRDARALRSPPEYDESLKTFFATLDNYRLSVDELRTDVIGDIGLAWGVHTEEFQVKGQPPEKVLVRFTMTFKYEDSSWRTLLYHRDIQPFGDDGRYIPQH